MKTCTKCKETKAIEDFHRDRSKPDGRKSQCAKCVVESHAAWRAANPETDKQWRIDNPERVKFLDTRRRTDPKNKESYAFTQRKSDIKSRYGLEWETYLDMCKDGCHACGSYKNLQVDHDHRCCDTRKKTCGKCVRGILCGDCNAAESRLRTVERAAALLDYISRVLDLH